MSNDELAFALERSFLAYEFLTWLWFRCEVEGGNFDLDGVGSVGVAVDDGLSLARLQDDELKASLRGGNPTGRPEAANALAAGLLLKKARLVVAKGSREWSFGLDAETLDLSGVKVVDPQAEEEEPEDALADKLSSAEELREIVDGLFREFLALRLDDEWEALEVGRLRDWVRTKLERAWQVVGTA
ncbi:MAG: hypothetical protein D6731_02340 [Planctomycetota bacterium]|nr:MAG: hypothetical protein D6731_02340 [Planctomycetota bacterium]